MNDQNMTNISKKHVTSSVSPDLFKINLPFNKDWRPLPEPRYNQDGGVIGRLFYCTHCHYDRTAADSEPKMRASFSTLHVNVSLAHSITQSCHPSPSKYIILIVGVKHKLLS